MKLNLLLIVTALASLTLFSSLKKKNASIEKEPLSEVERNAYKKLAKLCLNKRDNSRLDSFFDQLNNYDNSEDYASTLHYVIDLCSQRNIHLFNDFDHKYGAEDFAWIMPKILKRNFRTKVKFPKRRTFDRATTISMDGVFESFEKPLNEKGLTMGLIDTESDSYVILIHEIINTKTVSKHVQQLGYSYLKLVSED